MKIKLDPGAYCPTRAHETDAGLDIYSREDQIIPAHGSAVFHTGVHVQLPHGTVGNLESKSGLFVKHDILSAGTVDEGYDGEILAKLVNLGPTDYHVHVKDKITQLVIKPVRYEPVQIVEEIEAGPRGSNGFGSTGK